MTQIEWTEKTWNPIVGCTVTSPGCKNCYAMKMAGRLEAMHAKTGNTPQYEGTTKKVNGKTVWTGKIGIAGDKVWREPLKRKKPTRYFVNSMGDLFHPDVPESAIDRVFAIMALSPQHIFQILTKHPERMRDFQKSNWPARLIEPMRHFSNTSHGGVLLKTTNGTLPNVHLGVSVEDQTRANERIPFLLDTPAAVRFISAEPLLGAIDLTEIETDDGSIWNALDRVEARDAQHEGDVSGVLDWVIVGGESGPNARPMHPDWARSVRDQCAQTDTPFFFKQWGDWVPHLDREKDDPDWRSRDYSFCGYQTGKVGDTLILNLGGGCGFHGERVHIVKRVGKKAAGRTLDGVIHDGFPTK